MVSSLIAENAALGAVQKNPTSETAFIPQKNTNTFKKQYLL